jgi:aminopeptidase N
MGLCHYQQMYERAAMAGHALADDAHRAKFNPLTGSSTEHRAEPRVVDIEHIRLTLDVADLADQRMQAEEVIVISAPWHDVSQFTLHGVDLRLDYVECVVGKNVSDVRGKPATHEFPIDFYRTVRWFYDGDELTIVPDPPLDQGESAAFFIRYTIERPEAGLAWMLPLPGDPTDTAQVWSQGQTESNRFWMFAHDYPNERHSSEIIVSAPDHLEVSAAGELVEKTELPGNRARWHWLCTPDHVTYLMTLIIGEFHVERETWTPQQTIWPNEADAAPAVDVEYYVPPHRAADAQRTFRATPSMLDFFQERYGYAYPYPRYAQLVVTDFSAGGMENITATTMTEGLLQDASADANARACGSNGEWLIAHELAHQWFGDLITCQSWSHIWLNEGWATFSQALWEEHACSRDDYDYTMWGWRRGIAEADPVESNRPLVFREPAEAWSAFRFNGRAAYRKGAYVLHMLRTHLGEGPFWDAVAEYLKRYAYKTVTTADFRLVLEDISTLQLEPFFRQWLHRAGTPHVRVKLSYDPELRQAELGFEQTQQVNKETPAFALAFDVVLVDDDGARHEKRVQFNTRKHTATFAGVGNPARVEVDPHGAMLMKLKLEYPAKVLETTALEAESVAVRCEAIAHLGEETTDAAALALEQVLFDEGAFWGLRREAARALGKNGTDEALRALTEAIDGTREVEFEWRLRESIADALGNFRQRGALGTLHVLAMDKSDPVVRAALYALGKTLDESSAQHLERGMIRGGLHDGLIRAAMEGLAKRRDPSALRAALAGTRDDVYYRTRRRAVGLVGELLADAEPLRDDGSELYDAATRREAGERLVELADDDRKVIALAAIRALGKSRLPFVEGALQRLAGQGRYPSMREAATSALKAWRSGKSAEGSAVRGLRETNRDLEHRLDELEEKFDTLKEFQLEVHGTDNLTTAAISN